MHLHGFPWLLELELLAEFAVLAQLLNVIGDSGPVETLSDKALGLLHVLMATAAGSGYQVVVVLVSGLGDL